MRHARPPRQFPRTARVNEVIHEVLAEQLERLSDPRLELVTITGVDASSDLRQATVYYAVPPRPSGSNEQRQDEARAALGSAAAHLRAELGRQVRLKYLPALTFREDPSVEAGQRVDDIIRSLHRDDPSAVETGEEGAP